MGERLQKVLAAAGVASRREAEQWIRAGRITVNDRPAALGQRVEASDRIAVDGRRLRLERAAPVERVLIYHRPPGEPLRAGANDSADAAATTSFERLPKVRGRRWLPLAALGAGDGGLELFTTDGALRAAASRVAATLPAGYAVRVAGEPTAELMASLPAAAAALARPFAIEALRAAGGEGRNRWYEFEVRRAHGRELRALLLDHGLEVSRILRTRYGPIGMDRAISRGRHRELDKDERTALYAAVGLGLKAGTRSAGPSRPRSRGRAGKGRAP